MAVELKDLRAKISARTWCFLEAESRATSKDVSELVRDILGEWAQQRFHAASVAHRLLEAEGESGIAAGTVGKVSE